MIHATLLPQPLPQHLLRIRPSFCSLWSYAGDTHSLLFTDVSRVMIKWKHSIPFSSLLFPRRLPVRTKDHVPAGFLSNWGTGDVGPCRVGPDDLDHATAMPFGLSTDSSSLHRAYPQKSPEQASHCQTAMNLKTQLKQKYIHSGPVASLHNPNVPGWRGKGCPRQHSQNDLTPSLL